MMKYSVGLLGILFACSSVWAVPDTMEMYSTFSAPIASFWEVKTEGCAPVVMPEGSQLNLGFVATDGNTGSNTGKIQWKNGKPIEIGTLYMEQDAKFLVNGNDENKPTKWVVKTLQVGKEGTVTFNGDVIINSLTLTPVEDFLPKLTITNNFRVGSSVTTTKGSFNAIDMGEGGKFNFSSTSNESSTASWGEANCSFNEPTNCTHSKLLLSR